MLKLPLESGGLVYGPAVHLEAEGWQVVPPGSDASCQGPGFFTPPLSQLNSSRRCVRSVCPCNPFIYTQFTISLIPDTLLLKVLKLAPKLSAEMGGVMFECSGECKRLKQRIPHAGSGCQLQAPVFVLTLRPILARTVPPALRAVA